MAKLKSTISRLQKAIISTGYIVKINTSQFYSEEQKRTITVYSLVTPTKKNNKVKNQEILRSTSQIELIKCLAEIWEGVKDGG